MLAEHTFVTALDAPIAFAAAANAGTKLGFTATAGDWASRGEWSRGPKKPGYRSLDKLPMRLRMDFDRGRVNLALAIDEPARPDKLIAGYALGILTTIERCATSGATPEGMAPALAAEKRIRRRDFWRNFWIWAVLVAVFLGIAGLVVAVMLTDRR